MWRLLISFLCLFCCLLSDVQGQNSDIGIRGKVIDMDQNPLEMVHILIKGTNKGTRTNAAGEFILPSVPGKSIRLVFSAVGLERTEREIPLPCLQPILQILKTDVKNIQEITVSKKKSNPNLLNIQPKLTERLASIGGTVETIIKTLPGVSHNNELSSQYSVRGGNFDENLVYVNGIEVIRPFLVKSEIGRAHV